MARVVYDFYMSQAARALEIAYDSRKRKSYRLNRPLNDPFVVLVRAANNILYCYIPRLSLNKTGTVIG